MNKDKKKSFKIPCVLAEFFGFLRYHHWENTGEFFISRTYFETNLAWSHWSLTLNGAAVISAA